jgi:hypothetical protein
MDVVGPGKVPLGSDSPSRSPTFGHILPFGRSEADAGYDRSRCGADSGWCRKHRTEVPDADLQVTATPDRRRKGAPASACHGDELALSTRCRLNVPREADVGNHESRPNA